MNLPKTSDPRTRRVTFSLLGLLAASATLSLAGAWWWRDRAADPSKIRSNLVAQLDPSFPGRGTTDYPGNTIDDVPKGYAMILKAELLAGFRAGQSGQLSPEGRAAAKFLMAHADERNDGFPGWGVPIAWDPYGDGTINPAHTKYTISTAIVVDSLLDWIEADAQAPRNDVLRLARASLLPYLNEDNLSPSGLLPYSLEPVDRPYDTFNPAAYLAGVLQRFSKLEQDPVIAARMRRIADKTVAAHVTHRQTTRDGAWYWHYSISEQVPNDLAHAAYIIYGLQLYAANGGALSDKLDQSAIVRHLADFVNDASGRIVAWPYFRTDTNMPARSYDMGMGLYLSCRENNKVVTRAIMNNLPAYITPSGGVTKYPSGLGLSTISVREYDAYIILGVSACLKDQ